MRNKRLKPEKIVEREILHWAHLNGCWFEVYDSKATFSKAAQRYKKSKSAAKGTPDLIGSNDLGIGLYVELKAPGKEDECYLEQKNFLIKVINSNCFGAVVSSYQQMDQMYSTWKSLQASQGRKEATLFLLKHLPIKIKKRYARKPKWREEME